jgi:hypothetical protein
MKLKAIAALAVIGTLGGSAAAFASTVPTAGVGITGAYIGDTVTNMRYYGTEANAVPGNTPIAPGTSASFNVKFEGTGNVPSTLTFGQWNWSAVKGTLVPASWVTSTFPASEVLQPGQSVSGVVTVTVPASARPGEYVGLFGASASAPGTGNVKLVTGAADREYITVPVPGA